MPSNPGHASTPTQAFPSWWSTMLLPSPKDIAGPALPLIYPHSTSQASDPAVSVGKAALSEKTGRSDFTTWTQDFLTQPRKQILKLSTGKKKKRFLCKKNCGNSNTSSSTPRGSASRTRLDSGRRKSPGHSSSLLVSFLKSVFAL